MRTPTLTSLVLSGLAAGPVWGQVGITVGPELAPVNCPIQITISNDTDEFVTGWYCPFTVYDSTGATVPVPCDDGFYVVAPGTTLTCVWDTSGASPGTYKVDAFTDSPSVSSTTFVTIDPSIDAALVSLGVSKVGTTRNLALCAPSAANLPYVAAASGATMIGIPTCAGAFPLDADGILAVSLSPWNPFFLGFSGKLDGQGSTKAPAIAIPDDPGLTGITFFTAFATMDPAAACAVTTISDALPMTIE